MVSVSKLVWACVGVVSGVRRASQWSTAAQMVDHVKALVQETPGATGSARVDRAVQMLQSVQQAKEAGTDITATVDSMLTMVREDIIGEIKSKYSQIQTELDVSIGNANKDKEEAGKKKDSADTAWSTMNLCLNNEQSALVLHETEVQETAGATAANADAKGAAETAAQISGSVAATDFDCDASSDVNCVSSKDSFNSEVDTKVTNFDSSVASQLSHFNDMNATWTGTEAALVTQILEEAAASSAYINKRSGCTADTGLKDTAVCTYATYEDNACASVSAYETLVASVQGSNNEHSSSDLEGEFSISAKVECFLRQLKDETPDCTVAFVLTGESDVTPLSFAASAEACTVDRITFNAQEWVRPALGADGSFPSSGAYTLVSTKEEALTDLVNNC